MRKYEGVFIFSPELSDEQVGAQIDRVKELITANEGEIEDMQNWGKRKFAYPIKKKTDGTYAFFLFNANPAALKELDRRFKLTEAIIRFLIVQYDSVKKPLVMAKRKREFVKLSANNDVFIDYKEPDLLSKFLTDRGKIIPRRITGVFSKQQRYLATAIKRARYLALLPYVDEVYR